MTFDNNSKTEKIENAGQVGQVEQAESLNLLSLNGETSFTAASGFQATDSSTQAVSALYGNLEITDRQSSDNGRWANDRATGPEYLPSQSEMAGAEAAQIFANPNASAADRRRAQALILNSPNPERAVHTANNGYPVTQGGLFSSGRNSDSLSSHGLRLQLNHQNVQVPAVGNPEDAGYRPERTERVPVGVSLIDTRRPLRQINPVIHSR